MNTAREDYPVTRHLTDIAESRYNRMADEIDHLRCELAVMTRRAECWEHDYRLAKKHVTAANARRAAERQAAGDEALNNPGDVDLL